MNQDYLSFNMENFGRKRSICSTSKRFSIDYKIDLKVKHLRTSIVSTPRARPLTTMTKRTHGRQKQFLKTQPDRNCFQDLELNIAGNERKVEEVYFSNKLTLADNSFIFEEDAFKLQNLITGGYCTDDEYMSLSKFNQSKDSFILLK